MKTIKKKNNLKQEKKNVWSTEPFHYVIETSSIKNFFYNSHGVAIIWTIGAIIAVLL